MDRDFDVSSEIVRKRSLEIGNKIKICFWIEILCIAIPFLTFFFSIASFLGAGIRGVLAGLAISSFFGLLMIAASIVYAILLLTLKKYDDAFLYAGILYVVTQVIPFLKGFVPGIIALFLALANVVVSFLFVKYFIDALANSVRLVSPGIASSLEAYFNWYVIFAVASLVCSIAAIIPIINILAGIASVLLNIGNLIISIWRMILVWQAASTLQRYGK